MTPLKHTLKRELLINGSPFVVTLSLESLKLSAKGKRKGLELQWTDIVSGDAALSVALNASVAAFSSDIRPRATPPAARNQEPIRGSRQAPARRSRR